MRVVQRTSGVRVTHPDAYVVAPEPGPRAALIADGAAGAGPTATLVDALRDQGLDLVDHVALEPAPQVAGLVEEPATLAVPVAPAEQAVVLVEREGVYEWRYPEPADAVASFAFDLGGPVTATVLKFAVHEAMEILERHVQPGIVVIDQVDPAAWHRVDTLADVALPTDRAARILLAVHGTFSSTTGAFAGLAAHDPGRALLQAAIDGYDAVVGYDHRTLSLDPRQNAEDLLERLRPAGAGGPPHLDVLTHSRGGLVARSLTELLLPAGADFPAEIGRMIFVASTNAGTLFASPEHWKAFVDLYTNLVIAASRLIDAASPIAGTLIRGAVSGVGAFVKHLVGSALDPAQVPGLAAMDPAGAFVHTINETQPGQATPATSSMFAITSDFEADGPAVGPSGLPPKLLLKLGDAVVDHVFHQAANDLVVDDASMSAIDLPAHFIDASFDFGANSSVYHVNYFLREEVAGAIAGWLELPVPGAAAPA